MAVVEKLLARLPVFFFLRHKDPSSARLSIKTSSLPFIHHLRM